MTDLSQDVTPLHRGKRIESFERWGRFALYYQLLVKHVPTGKILNIGCGTGDFSWLLQHYTNNSYEIVNLDADASVSPDICHDIRKPFPFEANNFDGILALHVFEHTEFKHLPSILAECRRILRSKGYLLLALPIRAWFLTFMIRFCRWEKSIRPIRIYKRGHSLGQHYWEVNRKHPEKQIKQILRDAGFNIVTNQSTFYNPIELLCLIQKKD